MFLKLKEGLLVFLLRRLATLLSREVGEVVQLDEGRDLARVRFPDTKQVTVFSPRRLEAVGAAFETALVCYERYHLGAMTATILQYAGPSREQLLAEPIITDEEVREIDDS